MAVRYSSTKGYQILKSLDLFGAFFVQNAKSQNFTLKLKFGFLHDSKEYGEMITGDTKLGFVSHLTAKSHGFDYEEIGLQKKPPGVELGFLSDDVATSYSEAIKSGAISVCEPTTKPWGQIVSYVRDCNGFLIEICSPL